MNVSFTCDITSILFQFKLINKLQEYTTKNKNNKKTKNKNNEIKEFLERYFWFKNQNKQN